MSPTKALLTAVLGLAATSCISTPTPGSGLAPSFERQSPADFTVEGPLKFAPRPTTFDITPVDLMTRLYIFADDSMMGRDDGGPYGATKATAYIEGELRRLGLTPAGDNGTFFQDIGYRSVLASAGSTLSADGQTFIFGRDFMPVARVGSSLFRRELQVVNGGALDSVAHISEAQANGTLVLLTAPPATGGRGGRGGGPALPAALNSAAVIAMVQGDTLSPNTPARGLLPTAAERAAAGPARINVTRATAQRLEGRTVRIDLSYAESPYLVRNVVAIARGTDPVLRNQYVAIGAHSDHIGFNTRPVDHDSLRAYNRVMRPRGANDPAGTPMPEQWARIAAIRDSLAKLHPARRDSINNGADDDGSGSVTLLEIAEAFATKERPRRSVLFVWHAGEEDGLLGSRFFTDHPTVPRDSIVAQLNMDMVGRGRATDHEGGGPDYLRVIGARRLSTELGDIVERVNALPQHRFTFDYSYDAPGHPMNAYCRSDHYNYARFGIPIAYFGTGVQADYHMVTDEPQYIDYMHMARIGNFLKDLALAVGREPRPIVDKPRPDPRVPCRQ